MILIFLAQNRLLKNKVFLFFAVMIPFLSFFAREIFAGNTTVTTSVTVGNSSPSFTVNASELVSSDTTNPSSVGSTVTFTATATDGNNENYYLAICKSASVTAVNGNAPTCSGGNWCIGGSTASGSPASCSYTVLQADAETNNWYAYVCDGNSSNAACSAVSGAGTNASPFQVNHPPIFQTIGNTSPVSVGQTVSWTTSVGTTDTDTVSSADTVKLVICKTSGVSTGACDGGASDTWCSSSLVASAPNCSIGISIPTADTSYNAYAYLFDNHNVGATGSNQGVGISFVVSNATPVVSAVTLNSGSDINLSEGNTYPVVVTATVTDNNGCQDLSAVTASVYRSLITYAGCDAGGEANNNNCYPLVSCSVSGGSCTGVTDASADYTCTAYLKSFVDPTYGSVPYSAQNWLSTVVATDNNSAAANTEIASGIEVNTLVALDVSSSLSYGNLGVGESIDPLSKTTTVTATGNTGLDEDLSGTNMLGVGSTANIISVGNQKYSLSSGTAYNVGTTLTTSAVTALLNVLKPTSDTGTTKPTYWGLKIPPGTVADSYSGTVTVIARMSSSGSW